MDQQTMQTYIEDLLEERNDLYAKIRLLEKELEEKDIVIQRLNWKCEGIPNFGSNS